MPLILFFSFLALIFVANLVHAINTCFVSVTPFLLKARYPFIPQLVIDVYSVVDEVLILAVFPIYWMLALECKRDFQYNWEKFAENEIKKYFHLDK